MCVLFYESERLLVRRVTSLFSLPVRSESDIFPSVNPLIRRTAMSALLASLLATSLPAFNPLMKWFKRDKRMILTSSLVEKSKNCGENYTLLHNFLFIKCALHVRSLAKSDRTGVRVFIFEL